VARRLLRTILIGACLAAAVAWPLSYLLGFGIRLSNSRGTAIARSARGALHLCLYSAKARRGLRLDTPMEPQLSRISPPVDLRERSKCDHPWCTWNTWTLEQSGAAGAGTTEGMEARLPFGSLIVVTAALLPLTFTRGDSRRWSGVLIASRRWARATGEGTRAGRHTLTRFWRALLLASFGAATAVALSFFMSVGLVAETRWVRQQRRGFTGTAHSPCIPGSRSTHFT